MTSYAFLILLLLHGLDSTPFYRSVISGNTGHKSLCGTPDLIEKSSHITSRSKRSSNGLMRLPGKILRYRIHQYPRKELHEKFDQGTLNEYVNEALFNAIKLWEKAVDVKFIHWPLSGADIRVSFASFHHGDQYPFDGAGGEVAHAFYPLHKLRRGQIHIDDGEPWGPNGRNLNWVLAHEIGHSLGLPHTDRNSIMMPQYQGFEQKEPRLTSYDVMSIQALYGKKEISDNGFLNEISQIDSIRDKKEENLNKISLLCDSNPIDTIFALPNATIYVFKGNYFWRLAENDKVINNGPMEIKRYWGDIKRPIDAAFTDSLDWTWFIAGERIWRIDAFDDSFQTFSPIELTNENPIKNSEVKSIDSVLNTQNEIGERRTFIFSGSKYWNIGGDQNNRIYMRQLKDVDETIKKIEGAISISQGDFIFSENKYWKVRVINNQLQVERGYPKSTLRDWFNCEQKSNDLKNYGSFI